jgi:hypothetical protein
MMGFFDRIFKKNKSNSDLRIDEVDNRALVEDLLKFNQCRTNESYSKIVNNFIDGNYHLYIPSNYDGKISNKAQILDPGKSLKITSVFNIDGLQVIGVFSTEKSLYKYTKESTNFTLLNSKFILDYCQRNEINRVVIDSNQETMFVLEKSHDNILNGTLKKNATVGIRATNNPLNNARKQKLLSSCKLIDSIDEIYQFTMIRDDETILIIGIKLSTYSENSRVACVNLVSKLLPGARLKVPLEMFILHDGNLYNTVLKLDGALLYKK